MGANREHAVGVRLEEAGVADVGVMDGEVGVVEVGVEEVGVEKVSTVVDEISSEEVGQVTVAAGRVEEETAVEEMSCSIHKSG